MDIIDSSVSGYSVSLSEMLWVPLIVLCQDILFH